MSNTPLHITGSSRKWYDVIRKIQQWQQQMTKEEQDAEYTKCSTFTSGEKSVFQRNRKYMMYNRPRILPINVVPRPSPPVATQPACFVCPSELPLRLI
jgi:hypothetical protein